MHVMKFVFGMSVAIVIVVVVAWMREWPAWSILAITVATAVIAQMMYVLVMLAKAWFRASETPPDAKPKPHTQPQSRKLN
jgi:hypothetical protein